MGRLIAFDQQTASTLVARTRTTTQLGHGSPLKAALANENGATLLIPGRNDSVLVVSVRRPARERAVARQAFTAPPVQSAGEAKPVQKNVQRPASQPSSPQSSPVAPTPADQAKKRGQDDEPVAYEATGFLGLYDSPLYEEDLVEEAKQAKKKWWQKLLD
jgi:hypothetical protein